MKKLIVELMEKEALKKSESYALCSEGIEAFLEALVLLCNKLDVDIPLWTYREEKILQRKNEVRIPVNGDESLQLRIMTK